MSDADHTIPDISGRVTLDQQVALRTAAAPLAEELTGTFSSATIERFPVSSYDGFAGSATAATTPQATA